MRALAALVLLGLVACGQKGDLYLPDQGTVVPPESTPAAPVDPDDPKNPRRN